MTEREAWLYLERCWRDKWGLLGSEGTILFSGLCNSVSVLNIDGTITDGIFRSMLERIEAFAKDHGGRYCKTHNGARVAGYCWPLDEAGARQRADFCKAMAERCLEAE